MNFKQFIQSLKRITNTFISFDNYKTNILLFKKTSLDSKI